MLNAWESRKAWILAAALGCLTLLGPDALPVRAQDADRKVTLNLKDVPLRSAIDALFQGTGAQYAVDPNVPNVPVTLNIRDVGFQAALRIVIRQAAVAVPGLTSNRDADLWVIRIRPPAPPVMPQAGGDAPPEFGEEQADVTWDKIPVQFNNVAVFVLAFGGSMLPSEADVLLGGSGGGSVAEAMAAEAMAAVSAASAGAPVSAAEASAEDSAGSEAAVSGASEEESVEASAGASEEASAAGSGMEASGTAAWVAEGLAEALVALLVEAVGSEASVSRTTLVAKEPAGSPHHACHTC